MGQIGGRCRWFDDASVGERRLRPAFTCGLAGGVDDPGRGQAPRAVTASCICACALERCRRDEPGRARFVTRAQRPCAWPPALVADSGDEEDALYLRKPPCGRRSPPDENSGDCRARRQCAPGRCALRFARDLAAVLIALRSVLVEGGGPRRGAGTTPTSSEATAAMRPRRSGGVSWNCLHPVLPKRTQAPVAGGNRGCAGQGERSGRRRGG